MGSSKYNIDPAIDNLYSLYGISLQSDILFPELQRVEGTSADVIFRCMPEGPPVEGSSGQPQWFHHWLTPSGQIWLSVAKENSFYRLRFPDMADFLLSSDGKEILCYPVSAISEEIIRHLLLNQVMSLLLNQRGMEVLHASSVSISGEAIAFAGATGRGKSTLAASFHREGYPFVSDDCFPLIEREGKIFGIPSYPGMRLWSDAVASLFGSAPLAHTVAHYTVKQRLGIDSGRISFCRDPLPLKRIYLTLLEEQGISKVIRIESLTPRDALVELIKSSYPLDITDQLVLIRQLDFFERLIKTVPVRWLIIPKDLGLLPSVQKAILKDLQYVA